MTEKEAPEELFAEGWFNVPETVNEGEHKISLIRVPLKHGKDAAGLWYGLPDDLWEVRVDGLPPFRLRAEDRLEAREEVRALFPKSTFYR